MATLIDSDVLVWLTRGHPAAAERLHQINPWCISVVTYMELAQGCRDKAELARLKKGLTVHHTEVLPITPGISQRAADLIDALALSHSLRLADALIGRRHRPRARPHPHHRQHQTLRRPQGPAARSIRSLTDCGRSAHFTAAPTL